MTVQQEKHTKPKADKPSREDRVAAALRENLRKRKEQATARANEKDNT